MFLGVLGWFCIYETVVYLKILYVFVANYYHIYTETIARTSLTFFNLLGVIIKVLFVSYTSFMAFEKFILNDNNK